jgi:hypothetical protein
MPELQTLLTGLSFGESPRWHDGRTCSWPRPSGASRIAPPSWPEPVRS